VLLAAVAIPTAVGIPKAAKVTSLFMTVLPQAQPRYDPSVSGRFRPPSNWYRLYRRPVTRVGGDTTCARQQCLGIVAENRKVEGSFHALRHTAANLCGY
jgi:hypothetical protein